MKKENLIIKNIGELVTCSGYEAKSGKDMNNIGIIKDAAVVIKDGIIVAVGGAEVIKGIDIKEFNVIDAEGRSVLPGFVDSHTHFIFGGYREEEFLWRINGESYMEIMKKGGGIASTVEATRNASLEELIKLGEERLNSMLSFGVTTVEGKSGYGLDKDTEIRQLKAMKKLNEMHPLDIVPTYLGAHAVPKEFKGKEEEYIDFMLSEVMPFLKDENLAEFCDVFCEKNVFSIEQSRRLLQGAKSMGFKVKLHADEIVQFGGAELSGELKASSADHLLKASDEGIKKMKDSKVIATLLPCTAFCLKEEFARGRKMIDEGCAVALATDFNPGSCFTNSIPLMISLAVIYMKLTLEETITALTINGAAALNKEKEIGSIDVGKKGDLVILKYPSYKFLPYYTGVNIVEKVIKEGNLVINNK